VKRRVAGPRSLPVAEWPTADRTAWERALTPAKRLSRGGAASHLGKVSVDDIERRYGAYLGFLQRHGFFDCISCASQLVTEQNVKSYVVELQGRVLSTTVFNCVHKLRRAAELLSSEGEFTWLVEIERDLRLTMEPRSKFGRVVTTTRLVETGLKLIDQARGLPHSVERARIYRNGLMIAVLAFCPIRLKNFAWLEIGNTFQRIDGSWWIILPAGQTKSRRADERQVPELLTPIIDEYLEVFRPLLLGERKEAALWISSTTKRRMTTKNLGSLISRTTKAEIGVDVSPHLFRTAAASTAATHLPALRGLAAGLLGHVDEAITEMHYNRAKTCGAAITYAELLSRMTSS
jgi:integrase